MGDEFNKGYFGYGPHDSHEARMGAFKRQEDERREREREERAAAERQRDYNERLLRTSTATSSPGWTLGAGGSADAASGPATLGGCVQGLAIGGTVLMLLYALFVREVSGAQLVSWALQGAAGGAVAGVALYAAIVVLRVLAVVLVFLLKAAIWLALVGGGLYWLAHLA